MSHTVCKEPKKYSVFSYKSEDKKPCWVGGRILHIFSSHNKQPDMIVLFDNYDIIYRRPLQYIPTLQRERGERGMRITPQELWLLTRAASVCGVWVCGEGIPTHRCGCRGVPRGAEGEAWADRGDR